MPIQERKHRLPLTFYRGERSVFFTANVKPRKPFFVSTDVVDPVRTILMESSEKHECAVDLYMFMPDHLHLVLTGRSETADAYKAMRLFKQRSGYWLARQAAPIRWQKDFYDHIIRTEESYYNIIYYVLGNPLRAGLAQDWKAYSFKGSTVHDVDFWESEVIPQPEG